MILDLYAGPGGWEVGAEAAGLSGVVGMELDAAACETRAAAGHLTIRANVATYPAEIFRPRGVRGLIASPPCQAFSTAGRGEGRAELPRILAAVATCRDGWSAAAEVETRDPRAAHILQPLRYAWELRPEWIACEQVPPGLPVWEAMAAVLRSWGYRAAAVILNAADYGVPQTRRRAFLLARRSPGALMPPPTHAREPSPALFGLPLRPWVSMAEALGWAEPAGVVYVASKLAKASRRRADEPAPVIAFGRAYRDARWIREAGDGVRISAAEAAALQSFPPGYPFRGPPLKQFGQIGNAVPPGLAAAVLRTLSDAARPAEVAA